MVAIATSALGLAVTALTLATDTRNPAFALPGLDYWLALVGCLAIALGVVAATLPLLNRLTTRIGAHRVTARRRGRCHAPRPGEGRRVDLLRSGLTAGSCRVTARRNERVPTSLGLQTNAQERQPEFDDDRSIAGLVSWPWAGH
jgi:hypothetical protein